MIALRAEAFLFTARYFIVIVHHHYYYYYSDARTDTARAHGPPRFCVTYTINNGPKHPSFYIPISEHDSKFNTIYRTGVVLYCTRTKHAANTSARTRMPPV